MKIIEACFKLAVLGACAVVGFAAVLGACAVVGFVAKILFTAFLSGWGLL